MIGIIFNKTPTIGHLLGKDPYGINPEPVHLEHQKNVHLLKQIAMPMDAHHSEVGSFGFHLLYSVTEKLDSLMRIESHRVRDCGKHKQIEETPSCNCG